MQLGFDFDFGSVDWGSVANTALKGALQIATARQNALAQQAIMDAQAAREALQVKQAQAAWQPSIASQVSNAPVVVRATPATVYLNQGIPTWALPVGLALGVAALLFRRK